MAPSKLRRAIGAVKDQTSIGLAKVSSSSSLSDLDVAIVKATRHDEFPAEEKHVQEILSLTTYSRSHISACVNTIARRLNKTKNWTVVLKTLILVQRLLAEGDPAYEEEIFFATKRGTRLLNMSDFRDTSRSNSWDYSAFVRTYALYLDEKLEYRIQGRRGKRGMFGCEDNEGECNSRAVARATPLRERKMEQIFAEMQHLQQLLERFLACRPTGEPKKNRVVFVALYPIVKESFQIYNEMKVIVSILVDRFPELEVPNCVKVYEIFSRLQKQLDDLDSFYGWCKTVGIARTSEYPEVDAITQKKLELMDEFIIDKLATAQRERAKCLEQKDEHCEPSEKGNAAEEDMFAIKALPPPEVFDETKVEDQKAEPEEPKRESTQQEADLLNLGDDLVTSEDQGEELALVLFGQSTSPGPSAAPAWEVISDNDNKADWESALIQSASSLLNQKTTMGGGFDMLLLNGLYQHGTMSAANANSNFNGSASSVVFGSDGRSSMLALSAPPMANGRMPNNFADPFAPSIAVAPPPYVQVSDLQRKQTLLLEEQRMWQQYARDGMQGQFGLAQLHANQYTKGGYQWSY